MAGTRSVGEGGGPADPAGSADAVEDEWLFSLTSLRNWTRYALRSVRRHPLVALVVAVVMTLVGGVLVISEPPSYQATATILLRTEGSVTEDGTALTLDQASRQANGVITRRDSLDRMIDDLGLLDDEVEPPFFGRLSDRIAELVTGTPTEEERREDLRRNLRTSLAAEPSPFGESIVVTATWGDATQAKEVADLAFTIFFEDREVAEIAPKEESVRILTAQTTAASDTVAELRADLGLPPQQDAPQGSDLQTAIEVERDLRSTLQKAQLDLQQAQDGLQYRYALLQPAEVPPRPISGNAARAVALLMFVILCVVGACVAIDHRRGRVLEPWQLDRHGLRVIATVSMTSRPSHGPV